VAVWDARLAPATLPISLAKFLRGYSIFYGGRVASWFAMRTTFNVAFRFPFPVRIYSKKLQNVFRLLI